MGKLTRDWVAAAGNLLATGSEDGIVRIWTCVHFV